MMMSDTKGTPCISGGYVNAMTDEDSDLIYRSDALGCFHDWVDKYGDVHTPDEMAEYRAIEALRSVKPKRTEKRTETRACDFDQQAGGYRHRSQDYSWVLLR